jgi:hypothetical protein
VPSIDTAQTGVPVAAAASLTRAVESESREMEMAKVSQVRAWETTAGVAKPEEIRASVVASVVAGLQAAGLCHAEYLCVVGAIHALLAQGEGILVGVVVTATAVDSCVGEGVASVLGQEVHSRTVAMQGPEPRLVVETVEQMVRQASPALWAAIAEALARA